MDSIKHTAKNGAGRDSGGRFAPGCHGGPGRPRGSASSLLVQARQWAETRGLPMMIEAAEGGDMDAARLLVTLAMPKTKPVAPPLECLKDMPMPARDKELGPVAVFLLDKVREGQLAVADAEAVYEMARRATAAQNIGKPFRLEPIEVEFG